MNEPSEHLASAYPALPPPVKVRLVTLDAHACSYLPGRIAMSRAFWTDSIPGDLYHDFMDAGFRRSGKLIYQPVCAGCRACQQIRVPVAQFAPNKSQRRCWKKNRDLLVSVGKPKADEEKFNLYQQYLAHWHEKPARDDQDSASTHESFEAFLYDSPVETLEFTYRDPGGRLLAVGLCDVSNRSLSSVYLYFDPASAQRGLGTYAALYEIEFARRCGIEFYYLGYWIAECRSMQYKINFRPCEILQGDGKWRAVEWNLKI